ncbi:hypothetical protein HPB49_014761 [Dermacentor silvarum]|uniref:Uncharacterized protein n=1 Tax=Dermacentor silvarum TaxID=543639 RepID=A0ACB8E1C2_DERSI|nr:hypothetical protein HPB49_014761 [Dermacentor silvarum]
MPSTPKVAYVVYKDGYRAIVDIHLVKDFQPLTSEDSAKNKEIYWKCDVDGDIEEGYYRGDVVLLGASVSDLIHRMTKKRLAVPDSIFCSASSEDCNTRRTESHCQDAQLAHERLADQSVPPGEPQANLLPKPHEPVQIPVPAQIPVPQQPLPPQPNLLAKPHEALPVQIPVPQQPMPPQPNLLPQQPDMVCDAVRAEDTNQDADAMATLPPLLALVNSEASKSDLELETSALKKKRDDLAAILSSQRNTKSTAVNKLTEHWRKRIQEPEVSVNQLHKTVNEQPRMIKLKEDAERVAKKLQQEISNMKQARVQLKNPTKEESERHLRQQTEHIREVRALGIREHQQLTQMARMERQNMLRINLLQQRVEDALAAKNHLEAAQHRHLENRAYGNRFDSMTSPVKARTIPRSFSL